MQLSLITLGHVHEQDINALTPFCTRIEQLVLDINPRASLAEHRSEFNRAVDASTADWIIVIREREMVDDALAKEIVEAANAAKAWGFRIRTVPIYAGKPLRFAIGDGQLRMFHRRHYLRHAPDVAVQGTVIRLQNAFHAITFESAAAHFAHLATIAKRRSMVAQTLHFLRDAILTRSTDANTLRYLWTEAGFARE